MDAYSRSYYAIPPGETIKEALEIREITQKEFSKRMGMTEKHISKLINGEVQLTIEMANKLEMVLDIPAIFWCNLESLYREELLKVKEENEIGDEIEILEKYPYDEMAELGWVKQVYPALERVYELRKFFEVANLTFINEFYPNLSCVMQVCKQQAMISSRSIPAKPYNIKRLNRIKYIEELPSCGVIHIIQPPLSQQTNPTMTFTYHKKVIVVTTTPLPLQEIINIIKQA